MHSKGHDETGNGHLLLLDGHREGMTRFYRILSYANVCIKQTFIYLIEDNIIFNLLNKQILLEEDVKYLKIISENQLSQRLARNRFSFIHMLVKRSTKKTAIQDELTKTGWYRPSSPRVN